MRRFSLIAVILGVWIVAGASGCGSAEQAGESAQAGNSSQPGPETTTATDDVKTASATNSDAAAKPETAAASGTPEELMLKVVQLTATQIQVADPTDLTPVAETAVASADRSRHEEIVQLSLEVISQTHDDPEREQLFNNAVHYLSGAQLQLALEGDDKSEQELIDNATVLLKRNPKSLATVEANAKVVELAREKAERFASDEFAAAYANQARMFATNFSHEPNRAAVTLLDAARWCERRAYVDPAIACYNELRTSFSSTIFASQADGPIRRLSMLGQPLGEFGGPTIDGGSVQREHYNGQPMIVVFWDSRDPALAGTFAEIEDARASRSDVDIALIGVCLDEDERSASAAIESLRSARRFTRRCRASGVEPIRWHGTTECKTHRRSG